jgi:hypothetical protein
MLSSDGDCGKTALGSPLYGHVLTYVLANCIALSRVRATLQVS